MALRRGESLVREPLAYIVAQIAGCCAGAMLANAMFELPLIQASTHARTGSAPVAVRSHRNGGTPLVVFSVAYQYPPRPGASPPGSAPPTGSPPPLRSRIRRSRSARSLTNTFAGIRPADAPGFIAAQLVGAVGGGLLLRFLANPRYAA